MRKAGLVIVGHGRFPDGILSPLELLIGRSEDILGVCFPVGMGEEELEKKIIAAIERFGVCSEVIVLTDVMGGTPFKMAVKVALQRKNLRVVAGINLPFVLELAVELEGEGKIDWEKIVAAGREALTMLDLREKNGPIRGCFS